MSNIKVILIDLDDTVYPPDIGVWELLGDRIRKFMEFQVGIPHDKVHDERERLFQLHGTTMKGLNLEYGADIHHYLNYVHNVDLSDMIEKNLLLREALLKLPQEKWIFTNASRLHAEQVLQLIGIRDLFTEIIDVLDTNPYCKPDPLAFELALQKAGSPDPTACLFIDDRAPNLDTARDLGMRTIIVGPDPELSNGHPWISQLSDLPQALAEFGW